MKRFLSILILLSLMLGVVSAERVSGQVVGEGKMDVWVEHGSQSIARNKAADDTAPEKQQINYVGGLGFNYGVAKNLSLGLEMKPLSVANMPGIDTQHVYWAVADGWFPGSLLVQYGIGEVGKTNLKVKARYNLAKRKLTLDDSEAAKSGITEKAPGIKIHDAGIGIYGDTPLTSKLDFGFALEYLMQTYEADESLEGMFIDLDRNSARIVVGLNYAITNDVELYVYDVYKGDSDAVGKHDDDVLGDNTLYTDSYNVLMFGVKKDI